STAPATPDIYTPSLHDALPSSSGGLDVRPHRTREQLQRLSPTAQRFAPEQVERLDAVCPFVDGVQPVVAVELLDRILTGVSVSRSEEHTSELQSPDHLVCRLLL